MRNTDIDFDAWFDQLSDLLSDKGIPFYDEDAARFDHDDGKDLFDVVDEIEQEYR
jgi:hypothetical protein